MAENEFRLPGSPYEGLVNIIVAYGTRDEAAGPGDVSKLDAVHQSSVSRTNAFLTAIGVLRGEREKIVTRQGRNLALALERRDPAEIRRNWREIISTNEFLQNVVAAVKLREGMLYSTVQAYIAHAAGQPRNKPVMTGAGAIIEILKVAGLLREQDGEIVATVDEEFEEKTSGTSPGMPDPAEISISTNGAESPTVNIHLHVQCEPDEIEDLAPKLKRMLRELSDRDA
ncbi:MAG TPA: hypothetical protein VFE21_01075 [Rubrobacteraceae bacterium]|nr:hypothetical protein [Rubrobacteraceae bacterium]